MCLPFSPSFDGGGTTNKKNQTQTNKKATTKNVGIYLLSVLMLNFIICI